MRTKIQTLALGAVALGTLAISPGAQAGFKCWTNDEGIRECGNVVPPEYAQQKTETVNERGITVETRDRAKTEAELAEERRQRELEEQRKAEEEARRRKQAAYDRVLLSTFTSIQDIEMSLERKLAAIDATIEVTRSTIDGLKSKLEREQKRAAALERRGQPIPEDVVETMEGLREQIRDKETYILSQEQDKERLRAEYAGYLERFRELKEQGRTMPP